MARVYPRPGDTIRVNKTMTVEVDGRSGTVQPRRDYKVTGERALPVGIDRSVSLEAARILVKEKAARVLHPAKSEPKPKSKPKKEPAPPVEEPGDGA